MLLDRHADTILMRGLFFERSPDTNSVNEANNPLAYPKRLDHHVDTMLLHDLFFELSPDASVDRGNSPLADPKRLIKKVSTCPNETIADLHAYSLPLRAHTPVGPRTPADSFDEDIARVAPTIPIPRRERKPSCPQTL